MIALRALAAHVLLAAPLLGAAGAQALAPLCPSGEPADLGGGLVETLEFVYAADGSHAGSHGVVTQCASGTAVVVDLGLVDIGVNALRVYDLVREAVASAEAMTMGELAMIIGAQVAPARLELGLGTGQETCECAMIYPELRGDKEPWQPF